MSAPQEHEQSDGAPDAKRPHLDDQEDVPDPSKVKIVIKDRGQAFIIDRQTAINHSLYIERIMSGPWTNVNTGVIELEEGDHAAPYNVDMFVRYLEYAEDPLTVEVDPLDEIDDFDTFAELWLFADYMQSNTLANAIMDEVAQEADGSDRLAISPEGFKFWWAETDDRPSFRNLRGIMVAMLVESGSIQDDDSRHELMPSLPADAQQAIVDEIMRQHRDLKREVDQGEEELLELENFPPAGRGVLNRLRGRIDQKVVGGDYHAAYGS